MGWKAAGEVGGIANCKLCELQILNLEGRVGGCNYVKLRLER